MSNPTIPANLARHAADAAAQRALRPGETAYRMWEDRTSPYSAKMRAFLRYKGIAYRRMRTTAPIYMGEIKALVGFPIIPVILCPDETVLQDSTPMTRWLEARHPEPATLPTEPRLRFLHDLLEDFADEYVVRLSMHWRWGNPVSRDVFSRRIARYMTWGLPDTSLDAATAMILQRQSGFDAYLGLTQLLRDDLDRQADELLRCLDAHLAHHSYLLGDRPSVADFALYGQLWAHGFRDPAATQRFETQGPRVCDWLEEVEELGEAHGVVGRRAFGAWIDCAAEPDDTLIALLSFVRATYLPWCRGSAQATVDGRDVATATLRELATEYATHPYRVWAFEQVQRAFLALAPADRAWVDRVLVRAGFASGEFGRDVVHSGLFDGLTPPVIVDGVGDARVQRRRAKRNEPRA